MRVIDVFSLDEANAALEWHAKKLATCDGKDPDAMINGLAKDPNTKLPQWTAYLPEAKRFMIGIEAWFGENHAIHHGNGRIIEDAEIIIMDAP